MSLADGPETVYRLTDPLVRPLFDASARALDRVAPLIEADVNYPPSPGVSRLESQA